MQPVFPHDLVQAAAALGIEVAVRDEGEGHRDIVARGRDTMHALHTGFDAPTNGI